MSSRASVPSHGFSASLVRERLAEAKRVGTPDNPQSSLSTRFMGLARATAVPPAQSSALLLTVTDWPALDDPGLPYALREEVITWLLSQVDREQALKRCALQRGWIAQWHLSRFRVVPPTFAEAEVVAGELRTHPLTPATRTLFALLRDRHGRSSLVARAWIEHLQAAKAYGEVIEGSVRLSAEPVGRALTPWLQHIRVEARLLRLETGGLPHLPSDLDLAFVETVTLDASDKARGPLLSRVVEALTPPALHAGRSQSRSVLQQVGRGLGTAGRWLGEQLGGRSAVLPHDRDELACAPHLLAAGVVAGALDRDPSLGAALRRSAGGRALAEGVVGGAALTGGMLYTLSQIDGRTLDALQMASAGHPDTFSAFQEVAEGIGDKAGAATRLSGYVAEQQVALDYAAAGHTVAFPDGPTQPGYDLLIDGHPVQVKCTMSADLVREHLDKWPDIPVVVNAELADSFAHEPMVWAHEGLVHGEIQSITRDSLDALTDFGDADDLLPLPLVSLAFAAWRNYGPLAAGKIDPSTYGRQVFTDTAYRSGGSAALGGAAFLLANLVLPGAGAALVAGVAAVVGSVAGATVSDKLNRAEQCDARDAVVLALGDFAKWFVEGPLRDRRRAEERRHQAVIRWSHAEAARHPTLTARLYAASQEQHLRVCAVEAWISQRVKGGETERAQAGWHALTQAAAIYHPERTARIAKVRAVLDAYTGTSAAPTPAALPAPA